MFDKKAFYKRIVGCGSLQTNKVPLTRTFSPFLSFKHTNIVFSRRAFHIKWEVQQVNWSALKKRQKIKLSRVEFHCLHGFLLGEYLYLL
jgi:hypothetical protein